MNLHKTFSTPHGGGGPGAGPVGVKAHLAPFLPSPVVAKMLTDDYVFDTSRSTASARCDGFYGNFGIMVRAYAYIRSLGAAGLREVSENAVLNANYLLACLRQPL